jgi:quinol monooxygenase YgiN
MVLTSISFRGHSHKRGELLSAVDALVQRMRGLPGCFRSRVLVDAEDDSAFTILSEWKDPETAEAFLATREAQIFRGIRILMRDEPLIVFDDIHTRVTRRLRGGAGA